MIHTQYIIRMSSAQPSNDIKLIFALTGQGKVRLN